MQRETLKKSLTVLALATAVGLGACASRPAPDQTPPPAPRAPEVPVAPPAQPQAPVSQGVLPGSAEDFRVSVGERVFFGYDRFDLTPEARATLERQAAWLRRYPNVRVLIAGNCDERGTREYNLALGARRATAAKDYLVSLGVPAGRLETVSFGAERPIDPRASEEAFSLNRNAHTQIVAGAVS